MQEAGVQCFQKSCLGFSAYPSPRTQPCPGGGGRGWEWECQCLWQPSRETSLFPLSCQKVVSLRKWSTLQLSCLRAPQTVFSSLMQAVGTLAN